MPERARRDATKLYYSISEVAELVNVKPHVLRYWETQFKMLRPRKNRAGNRSYRDKEVQLALRIKRLLYEEGFTIAGARRKLLDERRSGQAQTELNFVGLSQGEFLGVLKRDLEGLLAVVRGERPLADLEQQDDMPAAGLLREVDAMSDEGDAADRDAADVEDADDVERGATATGHGSKGRGNSPPPAKKGARQAPSGARK